MRFILATVVKNRKSRVTLKDIARKTGLSVSTVSQILTGNQRNYSSEKTRELIKETAREMGYRPNLGHKLLKGESLKIATILISTPAARRQEHMRELVLQLTEGFKELGYSANLQTMDRDPKNNIETVHSMIDRGCDTFIMIGSPFGMEEIENILIKRQLNYVSYNSNCHRQVRVDSSCAITEIVNHFLALGKKNLFLANRSLDIKNPGSRCRAFCDALHSEASERIFLFDEKLFSENDYDRSYFEQGYEVTSRILKEHPDADAILYLSDIYALGGVKYISENTSLRIGQDIMLTGFNNNPAVRFGPFPITTCHHPVDKIAAAIVDNAFIGGEFDIVFKAEVIYNNFYNSLKS